MATVASKWVTVRDDPDAFDALFLAEYSRVVSIAWRVLGDAHEAEDVAQEVFCSLLNNRALDPSAPFAAAWLYRAAAHRALNAVRGRKRRQRREEMEARQSVVLAAAGERALDPQQGAEAQETRETLRAALKRLPEKQAMVLVLRYSGLSYAEVASALGVRTNAVGTLLRRAEAALRKEMTDETH